MGAKKLNLFLETVKEINKLELKTLQVEAHVHFSKDDFGRNPNPKTFSSKRYELTVFNGDGTGNKSLFLYDFHSLKNLEKAFKEAIQIIKKDNFDIIRNEFTKVLNNV
jgi:hypothetical protein